MLFEEQVFARCLAKYDFFRIDHNNALPPVLKIDSGDTVIFETMNLFDDQFTAGMTFDKLEKMRQW